MKIVGDSNEILGNSNNKVNLFGLKELSPPPVLKTTPQEARKFIEPIKMEFDFFDKNTTSSLSRFDS